MTETRERFISAATEAFAERGFYGASIASIADALPFTKQALLHHFGNKEKLYAEVLKRISDRLISELEETRQQFVDPREQVVQTFAAFYRSSVGHPVDTQLLMRELLDNKRRAETSRNWYLKPFLDTLTSMVRNDPSANISSRPESLAFVYQLLGAITYFVVSEPTLTQMYGRKEFSKLRNAYEQELSKLISARLS